MKLIQTIKLWLGWILYFLMTQDERLRYSRGKSKGMHCFQRKDVSCLLPGSVTEFSYDPTRKPVREYLTRKEYFAYHLNTKQLYCSRSCKTTYSR